MSTITPTVLAPEGYVRIEINYSDVANARRARIWRQVAGVRTLLRDAAPAVLSAGIAVAFDHEAPLDVPLTYVAISPLNKNADFETTVTEWTDSTNNGTIGTVTQSRDYYVPETGLASLKLTTTAAVATSKAVSEIVPISTTPATYTILGRLMLADYWTGGIGVQLQWYTGTTLVGTVGAANDFTPFPGDWGSYGFSATSPAGADGVRLVAAITGTPPVGTAMYVDDMYLTLSSSTVTAAEVVLPSAGMGWWTDPLHPATKVRLVVDLRSSDCLPQSSVIYLGSADRVLGADSSTTEVNDSPYPIAAYARRKSGSRAIGVGTMTPLDRDQLELLHYWGGQLFLQLPQQYREADRYTLCGDVQFAPLPGDQRKPWRVSTTPYREVEAPIGPAEGTWNTRYVDLDRYPTFWQSQTVGGAYDDFARNVSNALGTATSGQSWTTTGTATDYGVNGSQALYTVGTTGVDRAAYLSNLGPNIDVTVTLAPTIVATGAAFNQVVRIRHDGTNFYETGVQYKTDGTIDLYLVRNVTVLSGLGSVLTYNSASQINLRFQASGSTIRHKVWTVGTPEPLAWAASVTDATFPGNSTDRVYLVANRVGGNTNGGLVIPFDNLIVTNLASPGGGQTWLDALRGNLAA